MNYTGVSPRPIGNPNWCFSIDSDSCVVVVYRWAYDK